MQIISVRLRVRWIIITPEALTALVESQEDPKTFIHRHLEGDWGDVGPDGWAKNEDALRHGKRLFSVYHTRHGRKLFVVTEANRYTATILMPHEHGERKEIA